MAASRGKIVCEQLREVRRRIASANGIAYSPVECDHDGECAGTCPGCEAETRYIEDELRRRHGRNFYARVAGLALGIGLASFTTSAQTTTTTTDKPSCDTVQTKKSQRYEIFGGIGLGQPPVFPGGDVALMKFLIDYVDENYPLPPEGIKPERYRVVVSFLVTKTGEVTTPKVVRSATMELDEMALQVCRALPKFTPGKQDGEPADIWYTIPITFDFRPNQQ